MKRAAWAVLSCAACGCTSAPDAPPPAPPPVAEPSARVEAQLGALDAGGGDAAPASTACAPDMVEVAGSFCPLLVQKCLTRRKPWQCAEFEAPSTCNGASRAMRFCIDRYEWPNKKGELPRVMSSWRDAKAACESVSKRLCTESEWTLACEGPERLPFPYGYARDADACAIDKRSPKVDEARMNSLRMREAEAARLDQREPSGSRARCVSAFGVHDLTGNVDEFVLNESGVPYKSSLKGGNWGEYRNACRPATRGHDENWSFYQTGFRCCRAAE
jgi:formylglycine-generating enzyme